MIPLDSAVDSGALQALLGLLRGRRALVLAGAGCSTESGIPDYRGPGGSLRGRTPMKYQEFVGSDAARVRYWSRSTIGWRRVEAALPNPAHLAIGELEWAGSLVGTITQNVDGLHQKAGSRRVVELHGSLAWVRCLSCGERMRRSAYQARLMSRNPEWADRLKGGLLEEVAEAAPDGDAVLPMPEPGSFEVPGCPGCGGMMKPDVVFFGENVPASIVEDAWRLYDEAEALLVVGSSLTVYSGRRFVYRARKERIPIGVVNLGSTRADEMAEVKVEGRLGAVLPALCEALLAGTPAGPVERRRSGQAISNG
ncbi:MAG: NAD-dependent protein deacetylase [Gemmatimonadota bacterium]